MAARHCQWRVSLFLRNVPLSVACFIIFTKHATDSGAFASYIYKTWASLARGLDETRYWQWRAVIRIFEILRFSLLFLIILI
jgi:hypothetical protein